MVAISPWRSTGVIPSNVYDKVIDVPLMVIAEDELGFTCVCMLDIRILQTRKFERSLLTEGMKIGEFYTLKISTRVGAMQHKMEPGVTDRQEKRLKKANCSNS